MTMQEISIPQDRNLLAAMGRLAIAHGLLEYMQRMLLKTVAELTVEVALAATAYTKAYEVRKSIQRAYKQRVKNNESEILRMEAFLQRARTLSDIRNSYLHRPWTDNHDGVKILDDNHLWGPAPSIEHINSAADQMWGLVVEINNARLQGDISKALAEVKSKPC